MTKVVLQLRGEPNTVTLDADQTREFRRELARAKKSAAKKAANPLVAWDLAVTVRQGTKKTEYRLYARTILQHAKTGKTWQFYMGLLLLEWASA